MKDQRKSEIRVGIMAILGLIIFFVIFGWAKNLSLKADEVILKIRFDNVAGLEVGDNVTVNGVRKGYVEDFKVEKNNVLVFARVDEQVDLRQDAEFSLTMLDLMGGKKIDIKPGMSRTKLDINKIHSGIFYADIPEVMSMIGTAREDLTQVLKDVKSTLSSLNEYLSDDQVKKEIRTSLTNMSEITYKLNLLLDENRNNLKILSENGAELSLNINEMVKHNKEGIINSVKDVQQLLIETSRVVKQSDSLLTNFNILLSETRSKQNNIGKLMYDEVLLENLKQTMNETKELIIIITNQLKSEGIKVDLDLF